MWYIYQCRLNNSYILANERVTGPQKRVFKAQAPKCPPEEYREKWDLPRDYPMAAPRYAAQRSELAKAFSLDGGRQRRPLSARSMHFPQVATGTGVISPARSGEF
ncbi:hypothetical protein FJ987_13845 [Mesorhizobium sp. CU2]|nr:hypothetical protein FJ988_30395 [Mesorhizobium sp. CU3]TPO14614.1 hypothetical protein FJ987_13845 [Mesorhizobium sp. CU2]